MSTALWDDYDNLTASSEIVNARKNRQPKASPAFSQAAMFASPPFFPGLLEIRLGMNYALGWRQESSRRQAWHRRYRRVESFFVWRGKKIR